MRHIRAGFAWSSALGWGPAWMALALALAVALTAFLPPLSTLREPASDWGSGSYHERIMAEANPAAVLAWAKVNCFGGLELAANAPRTQMEIILQVAASYDAESGRRGIAEVCADVLAATSSIAARGPVLAVQASLRVDEQIRRLASIVLN